MKNILLLALMLLISFSAVLVAQEKPYVRKQLQPAFFIPESAKPKPERLPMPKYMEGQAETVKAVNRNDATIKRVEDSEIVVDDNLLVDLEKTPQYQQKYEDYSQDLESISSTGEIPENKNLEADLAEMNTDKREVVDKKPYQTRDTKAKFDKALEDSLNSN